MSKEEKNPSYFEVMNNMPEGSIAMYKETGGGRITGKGKNTAAVIEMIVDNEMFQHFAFQSTYGHPKDGCTLMAFIMFAVNVDEYEKQLELLKSKPKK